MGGPGGMLTARSEVRAMTIAERVAALTPASLDAFLAGLPPDQDVDMGSPCRCFLHLLLAPDDDAGTVSIRVDVVEDSSYAPEAVTLLPKWVEEWQTRCLVGGRHWLLPGEARAVLAGVCKGVVTAT